jgi:Flp pilus assembly protein TadD
MNRTATTKRVIGLAVTTAMAGTLLAGCTTKAAPPATASAAMAEQALAQGKHGKAIAQAEAAVLADPRNAGYRALLGNVYLDAGRFASAATSFTDAIELGDSSPRTALSLALALVGEGQHAEAAALLNQWDGRIATADYGLALALAGQPERGIHLMGSAIRGGENTAKMRQNLAYAYALAGRWREARLMASQDVPADKIDQRLGEWALMSRPDAWQHRVAALLQVPAGVSDAGQPVQLALSGTPSFEELAGQATALAVADEPAYEPVQAASAVELPALAAIEPDREFVRVEEPAAELPSSFATAFAAPAVVSQDSAPAPLAMVSQDAARFIQSPVVQSIASRADPAPASVRAGQVSDGTHLVQLGSFASEAGAKRAWGIYLKKYPELAGHDMVISEAVVRGKHYWRVSAAGFGKSTSTSMCGRVKASGAGCFAYAEGRPLPGAIDTGVRLARR